MSAENPERFRLFRLCTCPTCGGSGKGAFNYAQSAYVRCSECRGEGRIRQEIATADTPEAVGVAIVQLGREGEWDECAFGLLDRTPECETCDGIYPDVATCPACKGSGVKSTGTWLVLPWMPSARNVRDAARVLARSKSGSGKKST